MFVPTQLTRATLPAKPQGPVNPQTGVGVRGLVLRQLVTGSLGSPVSLEHVPVQARPLPAIPRRSPAQGVDVASGKPVPRRDKAKALVSDQPRLLAPAVTAQGPRWPPL